MSKFKSGFVAILGRPNVGKSTLLNTLLKQKVSIISNVPQTTRYVIRGVLNLNQAQIVFVDTPGIHLFKGKLFSNLNELVFKSLKDVELILYLVDVTRPPFKEEEMIMNNLVKKRIPVIMALNKIDISKEYINSYVEMWKEKTKGKLLPLKYFIPISALRGDNLDKLLDLMVELLPEGFPYYDKENITDFPLSYRVADIIREKVCLFLKEEIPHNTAVLVEEINEEENIVKILANILVSKPSQKKIIIGQKGRMIKEIGTSARKDLELLFSKKAFLELWVKVEKDWQNKPRVLKELGYLNP
ncbi:MAG TPA: GTPase Era [Candidatus Omnitrophica bacterium]|nr:MAG: GTPase Era [Candidatus Omnitrophota bacterium]RKY35792.1 MAG: GTPase Era [Candidatus Omnitrophota bacterium]RKY44816.1 MAG: GTPase Era [Candidatus Omnitrophota bacterium]HEC70125.1 GTPase Era [Candidatus Omnitrophota bacterium]